MVLHHVNCLVIIALYCWYVCPHQVIDGVVWFHLADLNESLCEGGHHMPHEVVPEGDGLSVQHLLLLLLHLRELSILEKRGGGGGDNSYQ